MRLLNTATFTLGDFTGSEIPKYAILSHRWEGHEVTFQDIEEIKGSQYSGKVTAQKSTDSAAWSKIKGAGDQANADGHRWIWIDSCCIDKTSSAELSEAINSMFNWYRNAEICYAYLSDVDRIWYGEGKNNQFLSSKWFMRGWTLQELLAPDDVKFFSRDWRFLGNRQKLWSWITEATGIVYWEDWAAASIAEKMSWASRRETTRTEDRAYSLLGLFGVNMPPLYGEGENAFIRLQLEILRISDDESIFAWDDPQDRTGGLLARSPEAFRNSGHVKRLASLHYEKPPYSMTNKGIRVEFPIQTPAQVHMQTLDANDTYLAFLQCRSSKNHSMLAILLRCIKGNQFTRVASGGLIHVPGWNDDMQGQIEGDARIVQVKQEDDSELSFGGLPQYKFSVPLDVLEFKGFQVTSRWTSWTTSGSKWDVKRSDDEQSLLIDRILGKEGATAAIELTSRESSRVDNYEANPARAYAESDRFIIVFNMYANRARVAILLPDGLETMRTILKKHIQPGDWMTEGSHITSAGRLLSGTKVTARLVRKPTELWLRSYHAEVSFEDPVELPGISTFVQLFELPNNQVHSIERRNSMSTNPDTNYHLRSFLEQKEQKQLFLADGTVTSQLTNISFLQQKKPFMRYAPEIGSLSTELVELPDHQIQHIRPLDPMSGDPDKNYYLRSFMQHKGLSISPWHVAD